MPSAAAHTLPKTQRLSGRSAIETLLREGRHLTAGCLRVCYLPSGQPFSRILVSVPKKSFKRAVRRNLLKRRIRESFRLSKDILAGAPHDMMFVYCSKEILPFAEIRSAVEQALRTLSR